MTENLLPPETDEKIGTFLKNIRLQKGVELKYVSQKTKINPSILQRLEENQFHKLPGKTYLRGFVSSYARVLEIDINQALLILDNTIGHKRTVEQGPFSTQPEEKILDKLNDERYQHEYYFNPTLKLLTNRPLLLSIIGAAILISGAGYFFVTFNRPVELEPISKYHFSWPLELQVSDYVMGSLYRQIVAKDQFLVASELPVPSTYLHAEKYLGPIEFEGRFIETVVATTVPVETPEAIPEVPSPTATAVLSPIPTVTVAAAIASVTPTPLIDIDKSKPAQTFRPFTMPIYQLNGKAKELQDISIFPEKIKYASVPGKQNVFINAYKGDTWVTYKQDDAPIKSFNLLHGKTLLIRGNLVLLFIGRTESAKVFLNGELVVTDVQSGVKSFVFPQDMAKDYGIPLFVRDKSNIFYTSKEYQSQ